MTRRGFTLVELVVVMSLVGLVFLIAAPSANRVLEKVKLEADARQMAWVMRQARQDAILKNQTQWIYIYPEYDYYRRVNGKTYHLSKGIEFDGVTSFNGNPKTCSFSRTGAPGNAGTAVLRNRYGELRYIIVSPAMGRIRISKLPPIN